MLLLNSAVIGAAILPDQFLFLEFSIELRSISQLLELIIPGLDTK